MENINKRTIVLTTTAMMFAIVMVFSMLESTLAPLFGLPPGVRLGLANIVVMYSLFFVNKPTALMLVILKSIFVFVTRGGIAGTLSFTGGMLAFAVMVLLMLIFKDNISILILSIAGAIVHNIGQLIIASLLLHQNLVFVYLPILLISGIVVGTITGSLLRATLPVLRKITINRE